MRFLFHTGFLHFCTYTWLLLVLCVSFRLFSLSRFLCFCFCCVLFWLWMLAVVICSVDGAVVLHVHSIHVCRLWIFYVFLSSLSSFHIVRVSFILYGIFLFHRLRTIYNAVRCVCCIRFWLFCFGRFYTHILQQQQRQQENENRKHNNCRVVFVCVQRRIKGSSTSFKTNLYIVRSDCLFVLFENDSACSNF